MKILSEIGDIKRIANDNKLAQFAGIAPLHLSSSGKGKNFATKQGNRRLQVTIYFLAIQMVQVSSKGRKCVEQMFLYLQEMIIIENSIAIFMD